MKHVSERLAPKLNTTSKSTKTMRVQKKVSLSGKTKMSIANLCDDLPNGIQSLSLLVNAQRPDPKVGFTLLPGELRNSVYARLLFDCTDMEDIIPFLQSCSMIRKELTSMMKKNINQSLEDARSRSTARSNRVNHSVVDIPYFTTSAIWVESWLVNIQLRICLEILPSSRLLGRQHGLSNPRVSFREALTDAISILALHIPKLTIMVRYGLEQGLSARNPVTRNTILEACYKVFTRLHEHASATFHVKEVVFKFEPIGILDAELTSEETIPEPELVFMRRDTDYDVLGYDPCYSVKEGTTLEDYIEKIKKHNHTTRECTWGTG